MPRLCALILKITIRRKLGGDEFLVLIEDVGKKEDVEAVAKKLVQAIKQPVVINGREISVRASIGIVLCYAQENLSVDILLHRADQAMYAAKHQKGDGYNFYEIDIVSALRPHGLLGARAT